MGRRGAIGMLVTIALVSAAARVGAQETQLDAHASFSTTTQSHNQSWGAGVGPQITFGSESAPARLSVSPGFDYMKQEQDGPSQESLSLDANVQPGGSSSLTPYVGGSVSANWSNGTGKQWEGSRLGLETMGGLQYKTAPSISLNAEERFGYIHGQEHTLTTRFGVLFKM
jgi:hypothetical protein